MSIEQLEIAANALDDLRHEVTFIGGTIIPLWITEPHMPPFRLTIDVDGVIEATSLTQYNKFGKKLKEHGFQEDIFSRVICRWQHTNPTFTLDIIPSKESVFGFSSLWLPELIKTAEQYQLPSGKTILVATPTYLMATKVEAFLNRGRSDFLASKDFEDIITLINGRQELTKEISEAKPSVRSYIIKHLKLWQQNYKFRGSIEAMLPPDDNSQDRVNTVILPRIHSLTKS